MRSEYTQLDTYRYERKFVSNLHRSNVEAVVKHNSAFFVSAYHPRRINNIYFDTPGLDCFYDNLFGNGERWKVRIRWYGNVFGEILNPILEFKIKKGLVGTKKSYSLNNFSLSPKQFDTVPIRNCLLVSSLPLQVQNKLGGLQPVLLNSYSRSYFTTLNKRFRITVDDNLVYLNLEPIGNTFNYKFEELNKTVIELKYDSEWDLEAGDISTQFPFRLDKNSKFSTGLRYFKNAIAE